MIKGALLCEGRGKRLYQAGGDVLVEFTDGPAAYDGVERPSFKDRGNLRNHLSCLLMRTLAENGVPTCFLRPEGPAGMLMEALEVFPLEVVCRNAASGGFARRLSMPDGEVFPITVVDFREAGRGPCGAPLRASGIRCIMIINDGDIKIMQARALTANAILRAMMERCGLFPAEIKFEFGRDRHGEIKFWDEITPDTSRLWNLADLEKIDKDRFRKEVGEDEAGYRKAAMMLDG